jgi:hypothetical protein
MDELAVSEGDADVRGAAADGLEEHEVPWFDRVAIDRRADIELIPYLARQRLSVLGEHVADEPAAIEARRSGPAVAVGHAFQRQRRREQRQHRRGRGGQPIRHVRRCIASSGRRYPG